MSVPPEVYIIGAGGHGKVAVRAAQANGNRVAALFDDNPLLRGREVFGSPIVGNVPSISAFPTRPTLIAIGDNARRLAIAGQLSMQWLTLVHPAAMVDASARLGHGALVLAGAVVQVDAMIGEHAIVNNNATVEHDCHVGVGAHVSTNACLAGGARIGRRTLVGAGAIVLPGIHVGDFVTIGAGAVVTRNLPDNVTVVGVPARILNPNPITEQSRHQRVA
jgi:sugar O-acyltransferase (sialic acid O-acetyltransferase NeuD family)